MDINSISDNKTINIEHEIINKKSGLHYINPNDKDKLNGVLDELHKRELFDKYDMSYSYTVYNDYIALVLYKALHFIR